MGKLQEFNITFDKNKDVYSPGESISGTVSIKVGQLLQCKAIKVNCNGFCGITSKENDTAWTLEEQYFNSTISVADKGTLKQGEHTFPFKFLIPESAPTSFEGNYGRIIYRVRAFINTPRFAKNYNTEKAFYLLCLLNLNEVPDIWEPSSSAVTQQFTYLLVKTGTVVLKAQTDLKGYTQGQIIQVLAQIHNQSGKSTGNMAASLMQHTLNVTQDIIRSMKDLESDIVELETISETTGDRGSIQILKEKKIALANLLDVKVQGALVRSRFLNTNEMDAPTSFFFGLEKKNGQRRVIHSLLSDTGQEITEPSQIRRRAVSSYSTLYTSEYEEGETLSEGFCNELPQVSEETNSQLEGPLTIQLMQTGKACRDGGLLVSMASPRAVITLLPKKGNLQDIKNWRPVSLLCVDYKLRSKALATRLGRAVEQVIHRDQTYCVPGRSTIRKRLSTALSSFLWKVMEKFGFSAGFIAKIKVLYNKIESVLKFNEPLLNKIRSKLQGLFLPGFGGGMVLSAYADDIIVIRDQKDTDILVNIVRDFSSASAARVNWRKSEALAVGNKSIVLRNWEDVIGKMEGKLSKWRWLLPQMSFKEPLIHKARLDVSSSETPGLTVALCRSNTLCLQQLMDAVGPELSDTRALGSLLGLHSVRVAERILQLWSQILSPDEKRLLRGYGQGRAKPDPADPFPEIYLSPGLGELTGPLLKEKAKGALIRARFTSMRDIDAPTTFFFNLERSVGQRDQMVCLRLPDGQVTSEPAEMRRHAVSFYTDLFKAEGCDVEAADELLQGLPQLSPAESDTLGSDITLEELTSAGQRDIQELQDSLALYRKAASAKVNWEKSEAVLVGQWSVGNRPSLPGNLSWGKKGLKVLGVWLGSEDMVAQNWEGLLGQTPGVNPTAGPHQTTAAAPRGFLLVGSSLGASIGPVPAEGGQGLRVTYETKRPTHDVRTIAEVEGGVVKAGKESEWKEQIIVPPLPQSSLIGCDLIKMDYYVKVCLKSPDVMLMLPIHIGNVSLDKKLCSSKKAAAACSAEDTQESANPPSTSTTTTLTLPPRPAPKPGPRPTPRSRASSHNPHSGPPADSPQGAEGGAPMNDGLPNKRQSQLVSPNAFSYAPGLFFSQNQQHNGPSPAPPGSTGATAPYPPESSASLMPTPLILPPDYGASAYPQGQSAYGEASRLNTD
ncbi:hypothetical protein JOQ06_011309 [Pogonophryne albipinna]|uniref:Arrestin C-terminal-like domain-containing protein n=1 Tax=Pogonophryne albipinna TaxID=1090488 RepID=A0AAD6BDC5_9TELE|nr:hypothetical protein JOQ06_011309 [Pogonophryne albipinna]